VVGVVGEGAAWGQGKLVEVLSATDVPCVDVRRKVFCGGLFLGYTMR